MIALNFKMRRDVKGRKRPAFALSLLKETYASRKPLTQT